MSRAFLLTSLVIVATPGTGWSTRLQRVSRVERAQVSSLRSAAPWESFRTWRRPSGVSGGLVIRIRQTSALSFVALSARLAFTSR